MRQSAMKHRNGRQHQPNQLFATWLPKLFFPLRQLFSTSPTPLETETGLLPAGAMGPLNETLQPFSRCKQPRLPRRYFR